MGKMEGKIMANANPSLNVGGKLRNRRGATIVLLAIVLVVLLGMCALVVDLGVAYVATAQLQNTADAAALAGAGKLREGLVHDDAKAEAVIVAAANTVLRDSQLVDPNTDVVVGGWDEVNEQVVPWNETMDAFAVQVRARRTVGSPSGPIPTFFAKIWGIESMDITRTSTAGLQVRRQARAPINAMVVQDGSTSFQNAWSKAINADVELLKLINGVSVEDDAAGMVTFNARLDPTWLKNSSSYKYLYNDYVRNYPEMNQGIKYTTYSGFGRDPDGRPRKTNSEGVADPAGQVRPMVGELTAFDPDNTTDLPEALDAAGKLMKNGNAWGDTDTAAGLNYAIDRLLEHGGSPDGNVIVLVSDGMPHDVRDRYGTYYTDLRKQAAIAAANRAGNAGIRIHTVTLEGTSGANFDFNEGLVRNGGAALRAASADDLHRLLIGIGTIEIGRPRLLK